MVVLISVNNVTVLRAYPTDAAGDKDNGTVVDQSTAGYPATD